MTQPASDTAMLTSESDRDAVRERLEALGHAFTGSEFDAIYRRFVDVAEKKHSVYDADLESIVKQYLRNVDAIYVLDAVQISSGFPLTPTATITLTNNKTGETDTACAYGTGPIDAVFKAADQIVKADNDLTEFSVKAITRGIDALGEVTVRVTSPSGNVYTGFGSDGDIIVSATRAYLNALNRLISSERD